jgi:hypothetical protein
LSQLLIHRDAGEFDSTQLMALKEFLPTDEERVALGNFCKDLSGSEEDKAKSMAALPSCEKYMIAMMEVKNAPAKFDCMLFRVQFQSLLDELIVGINTLRKACDEVRNSERLRKMMAMILTLVNQINTGGDGNMALGFSLEALLKLGEAKAFDKKTSVLHYLAKLIRQNDESLLLFKEDLKTVPIAEGIVLDGLVGDMKMVNEQLKKVTETAITEADALEKEGKLPGMPVDMAGTNSDHDAKVDVESGTDDHKDSTEEEVDKGNPEIGKIEAKETSMPDNDDRVDVESGTDHRKDSTEEEIDKATAEVGKIEAKETSQPTNADGVDAIADSRKMRTPMEVFIHKARSDVDSTLNSLEELKASYSGVLKYFGEDDNMQSNEFFGTLQKFIVEFQLAADQVEKTERAKVRFRFEFRIAF